MKEETITGRATSTAMAAPMQSTGDASLAFGPEWLGSCTFSELKRVGVYYIARISERSHAFLLGDSAIKLPKDTYGVQYTRLVELFQGANTTS